MEKKYTEAELTKYDKEVIISLFMSMQQLSEEELRERLGDKWKRLPDEVYKRLASALQNLKWKNTMSQFMQVGITRLLFAAKGLLTFFAIVLLRLHWRLLS